MIDTYSDFMSHLGRMVTFEGDNPGDASIQTLQTVLALAEERIYHDAKTGYNEVPFTGVTAANAYTLPANFRSTSIVHFGGYPLEPVAAEFLQAYNQNQQCPQTRYFAALGRTLRFGPAVADGLTVQGMYFAALPSLASDTYESNQLVLASPSLFLFACMVEAAPMYGFQDQVQLWNARYGEVLGRLNLERERAAYSAGRAKRRPSTQLMG